jgi:hypothetical protein
MRSEVIAQKDSSLFLLSVSIDLGIAWFLKDRWRGDEGGLVLRFYTVGSVGEC